MIQGEEEFLSHGRIFGAKSEVDRATRCARRARMQEMANDPIIKENLYGESDVPDLTPSDDEGEKPVAGPGAYSGTDDASQVQDRVSSSDKHCKQSLAKTGATHAPGAAPQGPVDPDRKGDSVTSGGAEGAISGEVMTHRQARESSTSTDISVTTTQALGARVGQYSAGAGAPGRGSSPAQARLQAPITEFYSISPRQADNALPRCGQRDWRERDQGTYARNSYSAAEGAQARAGISGAGLGATHRGSGRNRLGHL